MGQLITKRKRRHQSAKALTGIIILTFGILFLLLRLGYQIPFWVFSWKTILIAIGIVLLYKHYYKSFAGYVLITIGGVFLLNEFHPHLIDASLLFPIIIIAFGGLMLVKSLNLLPSKNKTNHNAFFDDDTVISSDDFMESTTFFGGVEKNIVSKKFKGGDFTTIFGGTEINLSQADIEHTAILNATTVFGGIELIVPSNWEVKSEVTSIFGSIEDKRTMINDALIDENKVLILKGSCVFGGIEIQSYK